LAAAERKVAGYDLPRTDALCPSSRPHRIAAGEARIAQSSGGPSSPASCRGRSHADRFESEGAWAAYLPPGETYTSGGAVQLDARKRALLKIRSSGRREPEIYGFRRPEAGGPVRLEFGGAPPGSARQLSGLVPGTAPRKNLLGGLQHSLSRTILGEGAASGFTSAGSDDWHAVRGVGQALRPRGVLRGNLRRYHAASRHLLPRRKLDLHGTHNRPRQERCDPPPQPHRQGRAWLSLAERLSEATARDLLSLHVDG